LQLIITCASAGAQFKVRERAIRFEINLESHTHTWPIAASKASKTKQKATKHIDKSIVADSANGKIRASKRIDDPRYAKPLN